MGESYIIDKTTKKLIWRFGNPSVYGAGKAPSFQNDGDQLIWGPHHAHIIEPGRPGAGNMLILDNGWNRVQGNRTRTIEVDMSKTTWTAYASTAVGALPNGQHQPHKKQRRVPHGPAPGPHHLAVCGGQAQQHVLRLAVREPAAPQREHVDHHHRDGPYHRGDPGRVIGHKLRQQGGGLGVHQSCCIARGLRRQASPTRL